MEIDATFKWNVWLGGGEDDPLIGQ